MRSTKTSVVTGGGIVYDSDPYDEWMETMNKLAANIHCITSAEERFGGLDEDSTRGSGEDNVRGLDGDSVHGLNEDSVRELDLVAGLQESLLVHDPAPQAQNGGEVRVEG